MASASSNKRQLNSLAQLAQTEQLSTTDLAGFNFIYAINWLLARLTLFSLDAVLVALVWQYAIWSYFQTQADLQLNGYLQ